MNRERGLAVCWVGVVLCGASPALSQSATPPPGRALSLARFAPATSKLFVRINRLGDVNSALHRTHAWRLYPLVAGIASSSTPADLSAALAAHFGTSLGASSLQDCEMALVGHSWRDLSRLVWMIRIPNAEQLEQWFPADRRVGEVRAAGVNFFHTADGYSVSVRDDVLAIGRRVRGRSMLRDVRNLMVQGPAGEGASLERTDRFREFVAYLPARELAYAYLVFDGTESTGAAGWLGGIDKLMLGLYEREGRLDVALRASRVSPRPAPALAEETLERVLRLPQTTVAALAMVVDFSGLDGEGQPKGSQGALRRYRSLLRGLVNQEGVEPAALKSVGPDVVVAWGQDLTGDGGTPNLAVLLRCSDAPAAHRFVSEVMSRLLDALALVDTESAEFIPEIEIGGHLGTEIEFVDFSGYAEQSAAPAAAMAAGASPAWAAWNNWLILASHREYLERIIDGQLGLAPTMAALRDVQALVRVRAERRALALIQGADAAEILSRWIADADAGRPSLLGGGLWGEGLQAPAPELLRGVELVEVEGGGRVMVESIEESRGARMPLRVDDEIIGAEGILLDLGAPFDHLHELLDGHIGPAPVVVRVLRNGGMADVEVAADWLLYPAWEALDPLPALRELAALGRTVQFSSWSVHALEGTRLSARLSLRFANLANEGDAPGAPATR